MLGDHKTEDRITEEFKTLIRDGIGVLCAVGTVGDRNLHELGIDRPDRDSERSADSRDRLAVVGQAASIFAVT